MNVKIKDMLKKFIVLKPKYLFIEDGSLMTLADVQQFIYYWTNIKEQAEYLYNQGVRKRAIVKENLGKESILKRATNGRQSRENLIRSLLKLPPFKDKKLRRFA